MILVILICIFDSFAVYIDSFNLKILDIDYILLSNGKRSKP